MIHGPERMKKIPAHGQSLIPIKVQYDDFRSSWYQFWEACVNPGPIECCYGCFCPCCANADILAASDLGSNSWGFNCMCVGLPVTKALYRRKNGYYGTCLGDACGGICCFGVLQLVNDLGTDFTMFNCNPVEKEVLTDFHEDRFSGPESEL